MNDRTPPDRHRIPLDEVGRFRREYVREIAAASAADAEDELFGELLERQV